MNNYEYIIASLPVLSRSDRSQKPDVAAIIAEIREQLSASDLALLDMLENGFDPNKLNQEFYSAALGSRNAFLRDYFRFDLNVRNSKVDYLNRSLGRPEGTDRMPSGDEDYEERRSVEEILESGDILERERGLDDTMWAKVDELTVLHVFDMDVILGFVVKLKIIDRWLRLDPATGRMMFDKLVQEIRNTR